jgi:hypothetical protein
MNQTPQARQIEINPLAVLSAILFNLDKTEHVKFKPDDSQDEVELDLKIVGTAIEDGAALCVIPLEKVAYYQNENYAVRFQVEQGTLMIMIQKAPKVSALVDASGKYIPQQQDAQLMEKLVQKLK